MIHTIRQLSARPVNLAATVLLLAASAVFAQVEDPRGVKVLYR